MTQLLTIDAGTTSIKVAVFDETGHMLATSLQEYTLLTPAVDRVELPAHVYWQSAVAGIREVLAAARVNSGDIAAVGVTGQGETIIPIDRDGRALRNAIVWLDNRAAEEAQQIAASFDLDLFYETTGLPEMIPTWPACKVLWIRNRESDVFARMHKVMLVEDYLLYRLTGELVTEGGVCTSTGYFDIRSGSWWHAMLGFLGIGPEHLPRLAGSGQAVGALSAEAARETGLSARAVAVTGSMDVVAGAVGSGNITPGVLCETTGTALVLTATVNRIVYDPKKRLPCYFHALPGSYLLQPYGQTAGMMLRWFRDQFGCDQDYDQLVDSAAEVPPGSEGLVALPHLTGATSPSFNPRAKGVFFGITLRHRRAHFVRAILEAVAFMLRENVELLQELGVEPRELVSLGGAARSNLWLQIKADAIGLPVRTAVCEEATSLGAAILAAVALGLFPDVDAACAEMVHLGPQIEPSPTRGAAYQAAYDRYLALFESLGPVFDR